MSFIHRKLYLAHKLLYRPSGLWHILAYNHYNHPPLLWVLTSETCMTQENSLITLCGPLFRHTGVGGLLQFPPCITLKCVLCVHLKGKNNKKPHWEHLEWLKHSFLWARLLVRLTMKQHGQTLTFCDLMAFSNVYIFLCSNSSVTTSIPASHTITPTYFTPWIHFQLSNLLRWRLNTLASLLQSF